MVRFARVNMPKKMTLHQLENCGKLTGTITSNTRNTHPKYSGQSNVTSSPRSTKAAQCLKWLYIADSLNFLTDR